MHARSARSTTVAISKLIANPRLKPIANSAGLRFAFGMLSMMRLYMNDIVMERRSPQR